MLLPVIMAGGSGSRLWPLSRTLYPKQFLSLAKNTTMLQETVSRLADIEHKEPLFICNEEHRFIVAEQLRKAGVYSGGIILEPMGKNTAPAIALSALKAVEMGEDPILLVLAADHVIQDENTFISAINTALPSAENGKLVTFGIIPSHPETGYGYIRRGGEICCDTYSVDTFVEKPELETARYYCESGNYYWNSGMFLFKASKYISELEKHSPEILKVCSKAISECEKDLDFFRISPDIFSSCPSDSIDYAVMEKTQDAAVVPMNAKWSDVGSWSSLWDVSDKDLLGNVQRGDVLTEGTTNSYIYSQNKLVATVGIDNLVVVETKDAVLVANKDSVQDVKSIVNKLAEAGRYEHLQHREVYRPWGTHDAIADGERYHVKEIYVKPGEKTALQMHYHRSEHWIVVSGTAKVRVGDRSFILSENQSTYIPLGTPHQLENPGLIPLRLIEVRSGGYLEEDDVVRLEDYEECKIEKN
ncbi:mannose-1-phosphate guanylyltransferase/mannose-6-phosphate isomerase [Enterovibrio baiacu]|uniref:mannose-1-phosphate guanylyltransferase/mannose-6-phosphate isomerase n=1 Tax=Enterovibrio baiacu TaxID=2491023 RepID=UPI001012B70E|nr:mannose-1-phosphate guanylyltransferase/mannose-6-phosphate isomerase [Enterovibrio baiacu]MBE1275000.1 mannose-1-phosphate guanylyltransferase/mannose-6-phosphate isomerase [Enterovibrio baiacu]